MCLEGGGVYLEGVCLEGVCVLKWWSCVLKGGKGVL